MRYELWETTEYDAILEKVNLIETFSNRALAIAKAVELKKPNLEIRVLGHVYQYWLSHLCNADGSWSNHNV